MLLTLLFVSLLVFVVVRVLPGDPALIMLGIEASPDAVAKMREALGLDRPGPGPDAPWAGRGGRGGPPRPAPRGAAPAPHHGRGPDGHGRHPPRRLRRHAPPALG